MFSFTTAGDIGALGSFHRALRLDTFAWSLTTPGRAIESFAPTEPPETRDETTTGIQEMYLNRRDPVTVKQILGRLHAPLVAPHNANPVASYRLTYQKLQPHLHYARTDPRFGTIVYIQDSVGMLMASNWTGDQFHAGVIFFIVPWADLLTIVSGGDQKTSSPEHANGTRGDDEVLAALGKNFHGQDRSKQIKIHREADFPQLGQAFYKPAAGVTSAQHVLVTFAVAEQPRIDGQTRTLIRALLNRGPIRSLPSENFFWFFGQLSTYVREHYTTLIENLTQREGRPMPETLRNPPA